MSSLKKSIGTIRKKRRNFSISTTNSTDLTSRAKKEVEPKENNEGLRTSKETLINILKHLDNLLRKYKEEERSTTHICTKVSEILNNYQITTNETSHSKFLAKIKWMKEYIARIQDPNLLNIFEKALNEVGDLLLKEDLKRLAINPENNNQGHLALGSFNNTEYLENIRIYLFDDTFKNFMVSVNDTVAELMQRIIGKISCLGKKLNEGFALWEIPHDLEQGQRKLLNSDLPVLIKRSWRRPSKFYFLTKKEEEIKIVKTDQEIKQKRLSMQTNLITPSGLPVKVHFMNDFSKMFLIQKEETCGDFKNRIVAKFMESLKRESKKIEKANSRLSSSNDSILPPKCSDLLEPSDTLHRKSSSSTSVLQNLTLNVGKSKKYSEDFSLFLLDDKGNISELEDNIHLYRHIERIKDNYKLLLHQKISATSISKNLKEKDHISSQSRLYEAFLKLKDGSKKKISFQGLSLESVPEELNTLQLNPISIDFSNNFITNLPDWMMNYSNVKVLNLSSNKLEFIPSSLLGMLSLQILDLSQNYIKDLDNNLFSMTQLKNLYLNYNKLESIPDNFSNLTNLSELTLSGNNLEDQSLDALQNLKSIRMLDISSNKLTHIPDFIFSFADLEELYLSCNKISEIKTGLYDLINLISLDLSQNNIVTIPNGIQKLSNLQELIMDYNPIISSPVDELIAMDQLSIIKIPNIDDFLIARKNMRIDRRLSNHRSTTNASIVDILMEQNGLNTDQLDEAPRRRSKDKVLFKSSSYHNVDDYSAREEEDTNGGECKPKTGSKRKKFSQKKFPTEPEIKIPSDTDSLIECDTDGYHIEIERDLGVKVNEIFTPLSLKFNNNQDDYFTNFHGSNHINYLAVEKNIGPMIISVLMDEEMCNDNLLNRVLIKNKYGDETIWLSFSKLKGQKKSKMSMYTKIFSLINKSVKDKYSFTNVRLMEGKEFIDDILDYESRMSSNAFKFGIIYAGKQRTENDIYGIKEGSKEFQEFIQFLGEKIRLKGWKNYSAGLDVENDRTGKWSIYQRWSTMEIMFHVSTLLPYDKDDEQQIERKKHIGNDIVVIIFQDENAPPFDPSIMQSFFNHVFVVIRPVKYEDGTTKYKVSIANKEGVKEHSPYLPKPAIFEKSPQFRKFLLTKLVNAERASYSAPNFFKALSSAREQLLNEIYKNSMKPENKAKSKKIKAYA